jgi:hypothetical protein
VYCSHIVVRKGGVVDILRGGEIGDRARLAQSLTSKPSIDGFTEIG